MFLVIVVIQNTLEKPILQWLE